MEAGEIVGAVNNVRRCWGAEAIERVGGRRVARYAHSGAEGDRSRRCCLPIVCKLTGMLDGVAGSAGPGNRSRVAPDGGSRFGRGESGAQFPQLSAGGRILTGRFACGCRRVARAARPGQLPRVGDLATPARSVRPSERATTVSSWRSRTFIRRSPMAGLGGSRPGCFCQPCWSFPCISVPLARACLRPSSHSKIAGVSNSQRISAICWPVRRGLVAVRGLPWPQRSSVRYQEDLDFARRITISAMIEQNGLSRPPVFARQESSWPGFPYRRNHP